jgi:hypothetical protein
MSVKRAVEWNFKTRLAEEFAGWPIVVNIYESSRHESRILPCIILDANNSSLAVDHPDNMVNFNVDLNLIILTNLDEVDVNHHRDIVDKCLRKMNEKITRINSTIQYLYIYSTTYRDTSEEIADRKTGTHISYQVTCHYDPFTT